MRQAGDAIEPEGSGCQLPGRGRAGLDLGKAMAQVTGDCMPRELCVTRQMGEDVVVGTIDAKPTAHCAGKVVVTAFHNDAPALFVDIGASLSTHHGWPAPDGVYFSSLASTADPDLSFNIRYDASLAGILPRKKTMAGLGWPLEGAGVVD